MLGNRNESQPIKFSLSCIWKHYDAQTGPFVNSRKNCLLQKDEYSFFKNNNKGCNPNCAGIKKLGFFLIRFWHET